MTFLDIFIERGYFYQATALEGLRQLMHTKAIGAYVGFDCTAKSLHVGSLMQIMIMRLLQQHGHKPIIIVGGATTKIGDPTGRDDMRKILSPEELQENIAGIKKSLSKFLNFDKELSNCAIILDNSSWLESLNYIDFLRDYGRFFSVNRMLSMDSVKNRLERQQSLTFLEFNYMLLQAYDFYHLYKNHGCYLQFGGSDQWGNIVMGVDVIKRLTEHEVYGITTPLLTTSSGAKMGKSASGAVWLNEDMLSPYEYFQYWRNVEDNDVLRFANFYAEFSVEEMEDFIKLVGCDINSAKKQLAFRITELCHGYDAANAAMHAAISLFESKAISEYMPTYKIDADMLEEGIVISELLHVTGLTVSKSEAKRLIKGGGVRFNDEKVEDENMIVTSEILKNLKNIKLSVGKKKHLLVCI